MDESKPRTDHLAFSSIQRENLSEHKDLDTLPDGDNMKSNYAMDVPVGKENARA